VVVTGEQGAQRFIDARAVRTPRSLYLGRAVDSVELDADRQQQVDLVERIRTGDTRASRSSC